MKRDSLQGEECVEQNGATLASPLDIERPRSALHSGDFREGAFQLQTHQSDGSQLDHFGSSPTTPWYTPLFPSLRNREPSGYGREQEFATGSRSRAPSLGSCSSSYVLKAPTSPLVNQVNNTDLDFSPRNDSHEMSTSFDNASRRRTLPPETFREFDSPYSARSGSINFAAPPRSSTSAYTLQLASSAQTSPSRTRRPSLASDMSPKPHAPMVGSYEESILRGRMSMNPSKPLNFTAQIGVMGRGKCKPNLKCPPHVSIPFPAVFYSYPTSGSGRSISDDSPSPYVGLIDLDNSLPKDDSDSKRRRRGHRSPTETCDDPFTDVNPQEALRMREKRSRRTESPKRPAGGCYRIPQQGQLQIVIKNPHKTAVKLFLVPYDLSDMEPGTKTFIRQRSYSAGPVLDIPLTARKNLGTDRPEASLNATEDPRDKPILRYLVHLNICCPSTGRYFLHSSIRVVFANRVPDGKEKLRNEIQYPDPRYAPYKPSKPSSTSAKTAERPYRRPTAGFGLTESLVSDNESTDFSSFPAYRSPINTRSNYPCQMPPSTIDERFVTDRCRNNNNSLEWALIPSRRNLPPKQQQQQPNAQLGDGLYNKLSKGDAGYGGNPCSSGSEGESLLAQRLRGLDVQRKSANGSNADRG